MNVNEIRSKLISLSVQSVDDRNFSVKNRLFHAFEIEKERERRDLCYLQIVYLISEIDFNGND